MAEANNSPNTQGPISGLARALVQANRFTAAQIEPVMRRSQTEKQPFIDALLQSNLIKSKELAVFCSETFGYSLMDIDAFSPSSFPEKIVDQKLMQAMDLNTV